MARVDISILREIVRVIEALAQVPEFVNVNKRRFQLTYLDDHRQRIEEALRRHDRNQLNMLFGQLASKVKYQALRMSAAVLPSLVASPAAARPPKRTAKAPAAKAAGTTPRAASKKKK